ncbi:hypothetical protein C8Q70DRAFT_1058311 [Cubamyces menziesii]|nr:hypothetical protein C8Q70DRAFT_1058311 [Cubamyces menziesii]
MSGPQRSAGLSRSETIPAIPPSGTGENGGSCPPKTTREEEERARARELEGAPALQRVHLRRQAALPFPLKKPPSTPGRRGKSAGGAAGFVAPAPPAQPHYHPPPAPANTHQHMGPAPPQQYAPAPPQQYAPAPPQQYAPPPAPYPYQYQQHQHAHYGPVPYPPVMPPGPVPLLNTHYHQQNVSAQHPVPADPTTPDISTFVPQDAEGARWLWNELTPTQQKQLVELYVAQQSHAQGVRASEEVEFAEMTVDGESATNNLDKGKGPATGGQMDVPMTPEAHAWTNAPSDPPPDERASTTHSTTSPPPGDGASTSPPPPTSACDGITNQFAKLLLSHLQESHEQMTNLVSTLITQQTEAHDRLRNTLVGEVRAVQSKVNEIQNPLPFAGRRNGGSASRARATRFTASFFPTQVGAE